MFTRKCKCCDKLWTGCQTVAELHAHHESPDMGGRHYLRIDRAAGRVVEGCPVRHEGTGLLGTVGPDGAAILPDGTRVLARTRDNLYSRVCPSREVITTPTYTGGTQPVNIRAKIDRRIARMFGASLLAVALLLPAGAQAKGKGSGIKRPRPAGTSTVVIKPITVHSPTKPGK